MSRPVAAVSALSGFDEEKHVRVAGIARALPSHYYDQATLHAHLAQQWAPHFHNPARFEQLHRNVCVAGRHLALPIDAYESLSDFGEANDEWIRCGTELGEAAVRRALERAGLQPLDIDQIFFTSITGISAPSLDVRLANRMKMRRDVKRVPIFGLGCVAGAAGLARAADYLRGFPDEIVVLLSVELCSLTLQRADVSVANLIASGLFGDGAAAVVLAGANRQAAGPQIIGSRSVLVPDSESLLGWRVRGSGFQVVIAGEIPAAVKDIRKDVDEFLAAHELEFADIDRYIVHPGGPKILEAFEQTLELPVNALAPSWKSLREAGNVSSASVLMILEDTMAQPVPRGSYGLVIAVGPGFHCELVLIRW